MITATDHPDGPLPACQGQWRDERGVGWECTAHCELDGEVVHLGGYGDGSIGACWADDRGVSLDSDADWPNWREAIRAFSDKYPPPVTDEEVAEAAKAAQALLERIMNDRT